MNVSISKKELDAIHLLIEQMSGDLEGASDPEYIAFANDILSTACGFVEKCNRAAASEAQRNAENKRIRDIMKEHPFETRGMSVATVKRLISR